MFRVRVTRVYYSQGFVLVGMTEREASEGRQLVWESLMGYWRQIAGDGP